MKAVYFASIRERIGKAEEKLAPPAEASAVGELPDWLRRQGDGYAFA